MSVLEPSRIIGGYAEDALLAGTVTRPHVDVDWLIPRREYELRLAQARELGFDDKVGIHNRRELLARLSASSD
jgi:hypothetical protein